MSGSNDDEPLSKRARNWVFTYNNYTNEGVNTFTTNLQNHPSVQYYMYAHEVGESGTPHLQGYIQCSNPIKKGRLVKMQIDPKNITNQSELNPQQNIWFHSAAGSLQQNVTYCSKQEELTEWGTPKLTKSQAGQNRMAALRNDIKNGITWEEIKDKYPGHAIRYRKSIRDQISERDDLLEREKLKQSLANDDLKPWQEEAIDKLGDQSDREVLWVYDKEGGKGKTWLSKYLLVNHGAHLSKGGKSADMAYAYNHEELVAIDLVREKEEYTNYAIIEQFKDGLVQSTKYESKLKLKGGLVQVIVFSNWLPDFTKLSMDRWRLMELTDTPLGVQWRYWSKTSITEHIANLQEEQTIDGPYSDINMY